MLIMLLALFLVTMFLGTPIAFSMSFASIVTNLTHGASSLMLTAQQCYDSTSNLSLLAVPFFMLAGSIMNMGGISRRLINFCRLFVGRIRGGLAIVAVLAAMIFAAISGSGPATVAALGVFMIPAMVNDGYDVGFAGALMGSAGGLGIIIPPSIPMVIYATLAGCSVGTMFCAGIVPGIILGLAMMIYAYIIARRNGYKPPLWMRLPLRIRRRSLRTVCLPLPCPSSFWVVFIPVFLPPHRLPALRSFTV